MGRTKTCPHVSDGTALVVVCLSGVSKVEHKKRGEASKKWDVQHWTDQDLWGATHDMCCMEQAICVVWQGGEHSREWEGVKLVGRMAMRVGNNGLEAKHVGQKGWEAECVGWSGTRRDVTYLNKVHMDTHNLRRQAQICYVYVRYSLLDSFLRLLFAIQTWWCMVVSMGGCLEQIIIAFWLLTMLNIAKPRLRTEVFPDAVAPVRKRNQQTIRMTYHGVNKANCNWSWFSTNDALEESCLWHDFVCWENDWGTMLKS